MIYGYLCNMKTDNISINDPFLSKRVKLLPCQKEMVKWWYENTDNSINGIARMFKVNKRTIQFLLFPERLKRNVELRALRGGSSIYYDREEHIKHMQDHRDHKRSVFKDFIGKDKKL